MRCPDRYRGGCSRFASAQPSVYELEPPAAALRGLISATRLWAWVAGSAPGMLLLSHASNKRLEGSVFVRYAFRPHSPIPVPQTDLPIKLTFKLQK